MHMATNSSMLRSRALPRTGRVAQAGWLLFALFALSLALPGIAPYLERLQTICHGSDCLPGQLTVTEARVVLAAGDSLADYAQIELLIDLFTYLLVLVTALSLIWRKPTHAAAVCGAFVLTALGTSTLAHATAHAMPILDLPARLIQLVHVAGLLPFFCLLPDGRFRPRWFGWVSFATVPVAVLMIIDVLGQTAQVLSGVLIGTLIVAQVICRHRSVPASSSQEQIMWVLVASVLLTGAQWMGRPLRPLPLPAVPLQTLSPGLAAFLPVFGMLLVIGTLTCLAVVLLNDELFRVDVALSRALVYSLLTLFVVGSYILIVGYLSLLFQSSGNVWFSLVATGLVAVLFQPVQARVQRFVNGLLYGKRDDPYQVLVALGQRLEAAFEPSTMLPAVVRTVRESLQVPYVAIALQHGDTSSSLVADGTPHVDPLPFPLVYRGETLGAFLVTPRHGEFALTPADQRLLADLAQQASVAVHSVRLMTELRRMAADLQRSTVELQHARERLVLAREEERRRIRRDLHDDLAPTLAGLAFKARTISDLLPDNPTNAARLAPELYAAIRDTVGSIRRLVHDLRPPALDELGLLAAIQERATQYSVSREQGHELRVLVEAPPSLPPLPAAVEVAAYRIVQEALMNVAKHAHATTCHVQLAVANALTIDIMDDGVGWTSRPTWGVGVQSMQERAVELGGTWEISSVGGGGTRIRVSLPVGNEGAA